MGEPINLNHARKAKAKAGAKAQAALNRVKFGRTGTQKTADKAQVERAAAHVEGHKRED